MSERDGKTPAAVPALAKRAGEVQEPPGTSRDWAWTEPTVWTPRMLAALETGVKGGKWYSLIDKVYSEDTLDAADLAAARWAWENNRSAGRGSKTLPGAKRLFLPMRTGRGAIGLWESTATSLARC